VTVYREHGALLYVDVKNVYFSPRLATERRRSRRASQGRRKVVLDMFSGVGPFAIQIALRKSALVHAIELNPIAYECLKKNIELNKLRGKVIPHLGNAREVVERGLSHKFDRVIMNLPEKSLDFIDVALKALRGNGDSTRLRVQRGARASQESRRGPQAESRRTWLEGRQDLRTLGSKTNSS